MKTMLRNTKWHKPKKYPGMKPFVTTRMFRGLPFGHTIHASSAKIVKKQFSDHRVDGVLVEEKDRGS